MVTPVLGERQSALEAALLDVHATLSELLAAADEQHAAVVAGDRQRLETVTGLQGCLSSRLARAERKRLEQLGGVSLAAALAEKPAAEGARLTTLGESIAQSVRQLQPLHVRNAQLLERSAELAGQTVMFLQRLVSPPSPSYGANGRRASQHSLLVDSRA
jgi:flagellar biosynthesis/type III secretory pathway chaperone